MRVGVAVGFMCLLARVASAQPTIVVVETRGAPPLPALASQIELHVAEPAAVNVVAAPDADPMTYEDQAAELVASGRATIAVWIAPVDRGYVVFVAGRWPGRALIERIRVDASVGTAELERTIALKIAGLLDAALAQATVHALLGVAPGRSMRAWRIEAAGLVARDAHERGIDGRASLGVARAWSVDRWTIAPALALSWQPSGAIAGARGEVSITEIAATPMVEVATRLGVIEAFARPRFVAAALFVHGATRDGREGDVRVFAPYGGLEGGIRGRLSDTVQIGLLGGCDLALIRNELAIDAATVVDLGRVRVHVGVALTLAL